MKKLILILLCLPMIGFGQFDKIIFSSGDTIYGQVIEVGVNDITYQHKGETTNNVIKKRELAKVIYTSGRVETFQGLKVLEVKIAKEENDKLYIQQKEELLRGWKRTESLKSFEIGFEFGPSHTSLKGNDIVDNNPNKKSTIAGGISFQYNFPKIFSIKTSISYDRKGLKGETITFTDILGNVIGVYEQTQDFDYLTIPILARFSYGKRIKFFFNTGPYFSYLMKSSLIGQRAGDGMWVDNYDNIKDFKKFDMGLILGSGCVFLINDKLLMTFEVRDNIGLYNIDNTKLPLYNNAKLMNQSVNFLFGISYIWDKK